MYHAEDPAVVPVDAGDAALSLVADDVATVAVAPDQEPVVGIATEDLADDVERVTDRRPTVTEATAPLDGPVVVVAEYGTYEDVDWAVDERAPEFDPDDPESYVVATDRHLLGAERALLLVGSDPRGTAYAAYDLAERIGVSPWYWWADVPTDRRESLHLAPGVDVAGPPSVRYRGLFINDEDWGMHPWATETFEPEEPEGLGPRTHEKLFELLLRLGANLFWPAMHPCTRAFFRIDGNAEVADRYAIVVGTSHCEPMHRNNVDEWDESERGEYNYQTNREAVQEYWRERVEAVADADNAFTIGMRGIHDSGMAGPEDTEERVALLERIFDDQREMLAEATGDDPEDVPQVFNPYKETLDLYEAGLDVPDDVTFVWPDDSHGYLRRLPTAEERDREGGHGVYYHLSYWGRPHDYQWLSSVPLAVVREELHRAYELGAQEMWVANAGDVKPAETELEFFFDLAWDTESLGTAPVDDWLESWATREFGGAVAEDVADVLAEYYRLALARKPEHAGWSTVYPNTEPRDPAFSAVHDGDEAMRRLEAYRAAEALAREVAETLPERARPAFYQLVQYPVRGARCLNEVHLAASRSRLAAGQGRATADDHGDRSRAAHAEIRAASERYESLLDGKWDGMMDPAPRELPVFDQPPTAAVDATSRPALGVAVEGDACASGTGHGDLRLPVTVEGVGHRRFVDVFSRGDGPVEWEASTEDDWLDLPETAGETVERRLRIGVDWDATPDEPATGHVSFGGETGRWYDVAVPIRPSAARPTHPSDDSPVFVETDGYAAACAEDATRVQSDRDARWRRVDGLNRTGEAAMLAWPPSSESFADRVDDAPVLEYDVVLDGPSEVTVECHLLPTQSPTGDGPLRYAVAVGDADWQVVDVSTPGHEHDPEWQQRVLAGRTRSRSTHTADAATTTVRVAMVDPGVALDHLVVDTGDAPPAHLGPRETSLD